MNRRTTKIWLTLGAISITAGIAVDSPTSIICGLIPLTLGAWNLITSGHTIRWDHSRRCHGIWTATCRRCPSTYTRGPLRNVLRRARIHQLHHH